MNPVNVDYKTSMFKGIRLADFGGNVENIEIAFSQNVMGFKRNYGETGDVLFLTSTINKKKYLLGTAVLEARADFNPFYDDEYHCWHIKSTQRFEPIELTFLMTLLSNHYWIYFQTPHDIKEHKQFVGMLALLVDQAQKQQVYTK